MSQEIDRCPICRKDFVECPHSVNEAEAFVAINRERERLEKMIRKIVKEELAAYFKAFV